MGWDICEYSEPVARKDYICEASEWIDNRMDMDDFSPEELIIFEKAKADRFKILKGTQYRKTKGFYDGEPSTFRARPEMDDICKKYDLYDA